MKTLMSLIVILTLAILYNGCSEMNSDITSPEVNKPANLNVPFKGNFEGIAVTSGGIPEFYIMYKKLTGDGNSTHLGKFTFEVNYTVQVTSAYGGVIYGGSGYMVAANGDKVNLTGLTGEWGFTSATEVAFTLNGNVSGGTGKFLNATGSFTGGGTQIITPEDPTQTTYSWKGTISY
jgi:hypothetical protein